MAAKRWLDRTQPQTLVMATLVLYINAALGLPPVIAVTVRDALNDALCLHIRRHSGYAGTLGAGLPDLLSCHCRCCS